MRLARTAVAVLALSVLTPAVAADRPAPAAGKPQAGRCEPHGVKQAICTRCNPKLAPVFKAKGDWCPEHERPESQCVLCNRRLAKEGVK